MTEKMAVEAALSGGETTARAHAHRARTLLGSCRGLRKLEREKFLQFFSCEDLRRLEIGRGPARQAQDERPHQSKAGALIIVKKQSHEYRLPKRCAF
ncbi:hypothetical protein Rsph17029_2747 [Rhodobacter sphaeroides ATCC 17029]|nr:hypothetical protein Rsph17029_2747 [Cereibacter sphaeroides ATCC 17029]